MGMGLQPTNPSAEESDDKVARYNWASPGDKGRPLLLLVDDLEVDHSYQRPEVSEFNTLATAREFSWAAFGSVIVMERESGRKFIVDGQQRWLAAKRRGIDKIPCLVFKSDGRDHEALAFCRLNTNRKPVRTFVRFRARAEAKAEPEASIAGWLKKCGLRITNENNPNVISYPDLLIRTWKLDTTATQKAIAAQRLVIGPDATLNNQLHQAFVYLYRRGVDVGQYAPKLQRIGGKDELLRRIRVLKIELAREKGKVSERQLAMTVLAAVNYKCRSGKILLPDAPADPT